MNQLLRFIVSGNEFLNKCELSRPFLDSKKARGCSLKPWSFIPENRSFREVVPLYQLARTHFSKQCVPDES
jgi:hypothetical protein